MSNDIYKPTNIHEIHIMRRIENVHDKT